MISGPGIPDGTTLVALRDADIESPATIVIGAVAALDLDAPLHGLRPRRTADVAPLSPLSSAP